MTGDEDPKRAQRDIENRLSVVEAACEAAGYLRWNQKKGKFENTAVCQDDPAPAAEGPEPTK